MVCWCAAADCSTTAAPTAVDAGDDCAVPAVEEELVLFAVGAAGIRAVDDFLAVGVVAPDGAVLAGVLDVVAGGEMENVGGVVVDGAMVGVWGNMVALGIVDENVDGVEGCVVDGIVDDVVVGVDGIIGCVVDGIVDDVVVGGDGVEGLVAGC